MKKLKATEGMMLTQTADTPLEQRVFTKELYLAVNDSPENWTEITEENVRVMKNELELIIITEESV